MALTFLFISSDRDQNRNNIIDTIWKAPRYSKNCQGAQEWCPNFCRALEVVNVALQANTETWEIMLIKFYTEMSFNQD